MRLGVRVGQGCENIPTTATMRDLQVNLIELDEQWDFIQKKQKRVQIGDPGRVWRRVVVHRPGVHPKGRVVISGGQAER